MKKLVLKLDLRDDKELQRKALKTVSTLSGIDEITIDGKGRKLTIMGTVDPLVVVNKLRKKKWTIGIISCGPKEEPKKEEGKKGDGKKEDKKEGEGKKEDEKKTQVEPEIHRIAFPYWPYHHPMQAQKTQAETEIHGIAFPYWPCYHPLQMQKPSYFYGNHSMEENPNACVIC